MLTLVQDIVQDLHVHDMNISEDPHFYIFLFAVFFVCCFLTKTEKSKELTITIDTWQ